MLNESDDDEENADSEHYTDLSLKLQGK